MPSKAAPARPSPARPPRPARRLAARALAELFGYVADAAALELPIADILAMAEQSAADRATRQALARARPLVRAGLHLSQALERTGALPAFAVQLLRTAEISGRAGALGEAAAALRDHYRTQAEFASRMRRAMIQPAITGAIVLGVALFVLLVLVPRLRPLFALFREAPWIAQAVFWLVDGLSRSAGVLLPAAALALGAAWWQRDALLARLPVLDGLVTALIGYQVLAALGLLLKAGLPAARALGLIADGLGPRAADRLRRAERRVASGVPLWSALAGLGLRAEALETIRRGHQLGQLIPALERATFHYRRYLDTRFDVLAQTLGLGMTLATAGLIALVGLIVFVPIYSGLSSATFGP
jgi:type II secretory pathway component PulF